MKFVIIAAFLFEAVLASSIHRNTRRSVTPMPPSEEEMIPLGCFRREISYDVTVFDPSNGATCTREIKLWGCYGSCLSFEFGGPEGLVGESKTCGVKEYEDKEIALDCPNVAESLRTVLVQNALECECLECSGQSEAAFVDVTAELRS